MRFAFQRGEAALRLAMHAAVPQVLRVELLHLLHVNFVTEAIDDPAVEADVLFAPFCESLGNGYYRFDAHARHHLVKHLDPHYGGETGHRSRTVASFLLAYFDEQRRATAESDDLVYRAHVEVERWVALAFFDAENAARQLADAIRRTAASGPMAARFRFAGLAAAVATPIAGRPALLAYAAGIEALERGDVGVAQNILEPLGDDEMVVAGVSLPAPAAVLRDWAPPAPEGAPESAEGIDEEEGELEPASARVGEDAPREHAGTIYVSHALEDREWADRLERVLDPLVASHGLEVWRVSKIAVGHSWADEIDGAIDRARVAIVLLSPRYLAAPQCQRDLERIVRRAEARQLRIAWFVVSECDWRSTRLATYQTIGDLSHPLDVLRMSQRQAALLKYASTIAEMAGVAVTSERPRSSAARADRPAIVLCYRRGDNDWIVGDLADRLRDAYGDAGVFRDADSLPVGSDFGAYIADTVKGAQVLLLLIGPNWLGSHDAHGRRRIDDPEDWVHFEIRLAMDHGVPMLPVLVAGADMPSPEALPPPLRQLARLNAYRLADVGRDTPRLLEALADKLGAQADPARQRARRLRVLVMPMSADVLDDCQAVYEQLKSLEDVYPETPDRAKGTEGLVETLHELPRWDAVVLVIGWAYGHVPAGEDQSVGELVYERTRERAVPLLAFVDDVEPETGPEDRIRAFRTRISAQAVISRFRTREALVQQASVSVLNVLRDDQRPSAS